jgi:hypothetical protein
MLYVAFILSIINSILWIVFAIGIRKVFKKMLPLLATFGIGGTQNLQYSSSYAKMSVPPELGDQSKETH